eukprot:jgi/Botrbrau1/6475/Bobra.0034s0049.1
MSSVACFVKSEARRRAGSLSLAVGVLLMLAVTAPVATASPSAVQGLQAGLDMDQEALLASPWAQLLGWNSSTHMCTWEGVECNSDGRVNALDLSSRGLTGTLPAAWATMSQLFYLQLSNNNLTGTLPASWANMSQLPYLDLDNNNLTGTLPAAWATMSQLSYLYLRNNNLTGTLPASWANMSQLSDLYLSNNRLTGTLPASWANMSQLSYLNLDNNNLTGTLPAAWANMSQLSHLNLDSNRLTGTLPASSANMSQLSYLSLDNNNLTGTLPASWANMSQLSDLNLSNNNLTGTLPASWANMSQLSYLYLSNNRLRGDLPPAMGNFVPRGDLSGNNFSGPVWEGVQAEMDMEREALLASPWAQLLGWNSSTHMCTWEGVECNIYRRVHGLDLRGRGLMGTLPASWANMSQLSYLYLSNNNLTGTLPASWANMSQLSSLYLSNNNLTGTLPASWANMSQLSSLYLSNNNLTGTLPASWANMSQLSSLYLGNNNFTGTLPASWANMSQLSSLYLGNNNFTGTLPASWANMSQLSELSLNNNRLTGTLPTVQTLSKYIDLSNNVFTGSLPSTIFNTSVLLLANNSLSGPLPGHVDAADLLVLSIGGNRQLSAPVPDTWWARGNRTLPSVQLLDIGHLMWATARDLAWKKQHCIDFTIYRNDDLGALEANLTSLFKEPEKLVGSFDARALLARIPSDTVPSMAALCRNSQVVPVLVGAWGGFFAIAAAGFCLRGALRGSWQHLVVDPAGTRGWLRLLADMAGAVAASLYWYDLVTDVLQIKDVWPRWPAFLLLAFSVLSFAASTCSMALAIHRKERRAGHPSPHGGAHALLALAVFARVDGVLQKVSGKLGKSGAAALCLPLAILCLPLAILFLPLACIFYCVSKKSCPDMESLLHGYEACSDFLMVLLRMLLLVPLVPILDFLAVMQYILRDTGLDVLNVKEEYLERYSHMRDITKALTTSLPTAFLTSVIYARGNRPDSVLVYNPTIFAASLVAALLLVLWAWLSTLYIVEAAARQRQDPSDKEQALSWADFLRRIGLHVWWVLLGRSLDDDRGPPQGQSEGPPGSHVKDQVAPTASSSQGSAPSLRHAEEAAPSVKPQEVAGPSASSLAGSIGSLGVRQLLRVVAIAAPIAVVILLEVYSKG